MPNRLEIAQVLREIGKRLDLGEGNRFRARAYERGARAVEALGDYFVDLVESDRLTTVPGIGPALASVIEEVHRTGESTLLEKLREELPAALMELAHVPGITARRRAALVEAGIKSLEELKEACLAGRVRDLPGFGEKTEKRLLDSIAAFETRDVRILLHEALEIAEALLQFVRGCSATIVAEVAGAVRRREEMISSLEIVACTDRPAQLVKQLAKCPTVVRTEQLDVRTIALVLAAGAPATVILASPSEYPTTLHNVTGSLEHVDTFRSVAKERGFELTDLALTREDSPGRSRRVRLKDEESLFAAVGLPFVPAEMREDETGIKAALAGDDLGDVVTLADVRGLVHCHTLYSDGKDTILDMARAADAMGMEYITITDHSPTASYAGGVEPDRMKQQWDDVVSAQEQVKVRILRGTESDILADGSLDYPDAILEKLDVIVASIHNRYKMDEEAMTKRIVNAMRHPLFKIWGHALGRLLKQREPIACDMNAILDAIEESRAAVEINGDPHRLDMEPKWIREARRRGINFVVSTDAHSIGGLRNVELGVAMARRGGVRRSEVLNALPVSGFVRAVRPA